MRTTVVATLLAAAATASACSPAMMRRHRTYQRVLATEIGLVGACDLGETLNVSNGGRWDGEMREQNPLLGSHPSRERLTVSAVAAVAAVAAFTYVPDDVIPEWIKSTLLTYVAVYETYNVYVNARLVNRDVTWCGRGPTLGRLARPRPE